FMYSDGEAGERFEGAENPPAPAAMRRLKTDWAGVAQWAGSYSGGARVVVAALGPGGARPGGRAPQREGGGARGGVEGRPRRGGGGGGRGARGGGAAAGEGGGPGAPGPPPAPCPRNPAPATATAGRAAPRRPGGSGPPQRPTPRPAARPCSRARRE